MSQRSAVTTTQATHWPPPNSGNLMVGALETVITPEVVEKGLFVESEFLTTEAVVMPKYVVVFVVAHNSVCGSQHSFPCPLPCPTHCPLMAPFWRAEH